MLTDAESLIQKAQSFDRKNRTISFGVCSPAPSWIIVPLLGSLYPHKTLQTEVAEETLLISGLEKGTYQLIALTHKPEGNHCFMKI